MEKKRNIVVTGAGGMIGGQVLHHLEKKGYSCIGIYHTAPSITSKSMIRVADLANQDLNEMINAPDVDGIVHCAAAIPTRFAMGDGIFDLNRKIDRSVIQLAKERKAKFVFISSTSLYGFNDHINREEDAVDPVDDYSRAKLATELEIASELPGSVSLRINAPYHQEQVRQTVLKLFIEHALKGEELVYHGSGSRKQDFTHTDDIADAVEQCLVYELVGGVFNIAAGQPIAMKELAELIVRIVGDDRISIRASGEPDPQEHYTARYSIEKARASLNWEPHWFIEAGIRQWIKKCRG